jgi:hypothetical protein
MSLSVVLLSCRDEKPEQADSVVIDPPVPPAVTAPVPTTGWDEAEAGPALFLSVADNSAAALVVIPSLTDSTIDGHPLNVESLADTNIELFSRRGLSGSTVLQRDPATMDGCLSWPQLRLADIPPEPWRIGFAKGVVAPLPLDSLEAMKSADSVAVTAELARMSSAVVEGDDPAFQGLPFTVREAYRFTVGGTSVLAGDVVRKINEEANPREEHLLLVAERTSAGEPYAAVYHNRVAGKEDEVRTNEILGAVRFVKTNRPALVIAFDYEDGGRVALLQRTGNRQWRITWRSAYTGC